MGKSRCASASRSASRRGGSTEIETETKAPSAPKSGRVAVTAVDQTLIYSSSIRRIGPDEKTLGPKAPRVENFEQTDSPLALFSVVAIRWALPCGPKSIHVSTSEYRKRAEKRNSFNNCKAIPGACSRRLFDVKLTTDLDDR